MKTKTGLRVGIHAEAMERIWHWTDLAKGEFSCLGTVEGTHVTHVQLFDQVCTASSTELDQQALAKFLVTHPRPEAVRAWIHSHGKLGVFWSEQDEQCIDGLANDTCLISIVVNKARQMKCRVDLWQPVRVTLDDVPVDIVLPDFNLRAECQALFDAHVIEAPLAVTSRWSPLMQPPVQKQVPGRMDWPDYDDFADWR
jgi:hypothetical protein